MTIGNLPKDIRSRPSQGGQILLGYLPTTKLEHITNKAARRRTLANLFHACMRRILAPLHKAGLEGMEVCDGDGQVRRGHPIYAAYVADYPEQVLVTGAKSGDCAICPAPHNLFGEDDDYPLRDLGEVLDVLDSADTSPLQYVHACKSIRMKPIYRPFWHGLPYADVFLSITPDILHQLHQGVIKHLISWITSAYDSAEIDARCRRFPPSHSIHVFFKGITSLSRLTGREHADICRILLGLVVDLPLPAEHSQDQLVLATRSLLDFTYLSQHPVHSCDTLDALDEAMTTFHANKQVFVSLGIREHFHLPKLHFVTRHYRHLIELFGAADNFSTEYTERLHIDLTKEAYRATNRKDEYTQMTLWLERKEKILRHAAYIKWCQQGRPPTTALNPLHSRHQRHILMTREPSAKRVSFTALAQDYGGVDFERCFARYVVGHNHPDLARSMVDYVAKSVSFPFGAVAVYHKAKIWDEDFPRYRHASDDYDVIVSTPSRRDKHGTIIPGRFDTALVNEGFGRSIGIEGKPSSY